jgi:PTS system sucrose-specific IIC component
MEISMDYDNIARRLIEEIGGKENIISVMHCATRLRILLKDSGKCNKKAVKEISGVKGVYAGREQIQVIFGTGIVDRVYEAFLACSGVREMTDDEARQMAGLGMHPFSMFIKIIGDIFVPIIPAIVASGFLMGVMEALKFMVNNGFLSMNTSNSIYQFADLFSNVAYTFLPILIAFSAAKVFGANQYLGAVIGMIMIHPDLQNAWTVAENGVERTQSVFFGLWHINMVGYQGHVIPVVIAVFMLSRIEKFLHKHVPAMIDLFVTPLVSVFVTGYITLAAVGPVFVWVENNILDGIQWVMTLPFGLGNLLIGGIYAVTVVFGIHHMYNLIDLGQLAKYGQTHWLSLASAANMAQGAAALAVGLKTKDRQLKAVAMPSALSACLGITEPAIFGVNLRFGKPFIAGCIGGGCGAMYASIKGIGASGTGVTGIFGILLHLADPVNYIIAMGIAMIVAFVLTWLFGFQDGKEEGILVFAPVEGKVVAMSEVEDKMLASEVLGKGVAILPKKGRVVAPFDGQVCVLSHTKHAIGLIGKQGVELLIHVGIDTVTLNGVGFRAYVKEGDTVKQGQLLLEFDIDTIQAAGLKTTTPIIVSNTRAYSKVQMVAGGTCRIGQMLLKIVE